MTKYLLPIIKAVTPIKYMGSKSRIAKHIVPIIQKYIDENKPTFYLEPFVGGANVIDKIKHPNKFGSDKNKYLIALLKLVQSGKPLYESVPKELYDKAIIAFNNGDTSDFEDWQIGNIGFLASYNGRWFDGGYAKSGYDIVCSGITTATYTSINLIDKINSECFNLTVNDDAGYLHMSLDYQLLTKEEVELIQLIIRNLIDMYEEIKRNYPKYLKIEIL